MNSDRWLEDRLGKPRAGQTTLVLCRSRSTVTRVRRWMAERGGWIGADVVTPHGLVASLERPALGVDPPSSTLPLPPGNPISAQIGPRPGLVAAARRWVRRARERHTVGEPLDGLPDWLTDLVACGWADDGDRERLATALDRLRANPRNPTESHVYNRIVLLGFDAGRAPLEPGALAVAQAVLQGPLPADPPPANRPIPAIDVPDAVAEVRLAAQLALAEPDTLVLVSEDSTARRLRDALARNGVSCGFTDPPPAAASALGGLVLRMVPWFLGDDAPLRVLDVAWVFGHRVLSGGLSPVAERALEREREAQGLEARLVRPGRRALAECLRETRILDAPLSRWIARLGVVAFDAARKDWIRGAALALRVRLQLLQARAGGERPSMGLGAAADSGPALDDFDALVAELLGEEALQIEAAEDEALPAAHSIGALLLFLRDLRPRLHDDVAARAVMGALKDRWSLGADVATVREALNSPVEPGALGAGVDILRYDDWDGRPARQLLLLDVHHKGLSRRPTPDPLLTEAEQHAVGVLAGQALVDFRVDQLLRACAEAESVVALVAHRDAGGRDLVPPIQLRMEPADSPVQQSYGLDAQLPERARARALTVQLEGEPQRPPATAEGTLAVQANAEWFRAGRGPLPPTAQPRRVARYAPLDERLAVLRPIAPDWLLPWLGHAESVPEAALPADVAFSSSRLFGPLSQCAYKAFTTAVLRVQAQEEVPEDLDPREIGTAIHDALEELGAGLRLRVPRDQLDQARAEVVERLRSETRLRLEAARAELQGLSDARQAAVLGRMERWNAHWPSWAASRIQANPKQDWSQKQIFLKAHPMVHRAVLAMRADVPGAANQPERNLRDWLLDTVKEIEERGADPATWSDSLLAREGKRYGALDASMAAGLRRFLDHPAFRGARAAWKSAEVRANGSAAPVSATGVEVPFGRPDEPPGQLVGSDGSLLELDLGEVALPLGSGSVKVSGRIDRLVVAMHDSGRPMVEIVDYKTSRSKPGSTYGAQKELLDGREPQLMVYALALREALRANDLGPSLNHAYISAVGWDYVRHTEGDPTDGTRQPQPNELGRFLVDNPMLDLVAERIGTLVDEGRAGRWTLLPRPDACPALSGWGAYCDMQGACRLTELPPTDEAADP